MENELEQLGERIAEQAAHFDAAMHRLLTDLREFDERGGWHVQAAESCAHWLAWRVGWDLVTARERTRVARKLAEFPAIDDALRRGEVSYSKVRAMLRVATPANEVLLLDHARLMTASQLEKLSRKYALVQRHGQDLHPAGDEQRRYVRRRDTEDGMVKIEAVLHPEEAELVWTMLNHAATQGACEPARLAASDSAETWSAAHSSELVGTSPLQNTAIDRHDNSEEPLAMLPMSGVLTATMIVSSARLGVCQLADSTESPGPRSVRDATGGEPREACVINDSAESAGPLSVRSTIATGHPEACVADNPAESPGEHRVASAVTTPLLGAIEGWPATDLGALSGEHVSDAAIATGAEPPKRSLLDQLLDEGELLRGAEAGSRKESVASTSEPVEPVSGPRASVLYQRADATRRAFNRADALVSLAQGYLRGDRPNRSPIEITLTIPESTLRSEDADPVAVGEMGDSFISREVARRLSCDAGVVEVVEDEHGGPLSVGRKRRTIAGALKRALHKRDNACTYPGCSNRIFLEGHHIKHWADGGETNLTNAVLLCSLHHRHVHEYGYAIELGPDQRPRFRDPHGRLVAAVPVRPAVVDLGWPGIRAMNEPLAIDAATIAGPWDGTPVDYGVIVGHLAAADGLD